MNRSDIFILKDGEGSTFMYDENLPRLPLPKLEDTLQRYYESLKPFGTEEELKKSQRIIREFQQGVGAELQRKLETRAAERKNWLGEWWEQYAYHTLQMPLQPYTVMAMPVIMEPVGVTETPENGLKAASRCLYHTIEYADLIRREKLKPSSASGGKVKHSSNLLRKFNATSRIPGVGMDRVECHFRTVSEEGDCPKHGLVVARGRVFIFNCFHSDWSIVSPPEILAVLERIRGMTEHTELGDCVPVLTNDERSSWAKNRVHLQELSPRNKDLLKLVESSVVVLVLDDHEPKTYEEVCNMAIAGDFYSKWADRSSMMILYKSGRIACVGEHSCYDGTISVHYGLFVQLSLYESMEPDWDAKCTQTPEIVEIKFELDGQLRNEIQRMKEVSNGMSNDVIVSYEIFDSYGKDFIKSLKLHPDSFIQIVIQWAYYKLHNELAPTYETALMRNYYNGRTETLRSCTTEYVNFVKIYRNSKKRENKAIYDAFRAAVTHHNRMMSEACQGNGVDRHLFGLWCVAYENSLRTPELYEDPLYLRSGGGGNFVLSTSTLGYTMNCGFVAPMILDGYGVFYSITSEALHFQITTFRQSEKTSGKKLTRAIFETFEEVRKLMEKVGGNATAKL